MTRFVPIVVVAPEAVVDLLAEFAATPDAAAALALISDAMKRSGWTAEMVMGGVVLADALSGEMRARENR